MYYLNLLTSWSTVNLHQRGYLLVAFSKEQIDAQWFFVDDITKKQYQTKLGHQQSYTGSELSALDPFDSTARQRSQYGRQSLVF